MSFDEASRFVIYLRNNPYIFDYVLSTFGLVYSKKQVGDRINDFGEQDSQSSNGSSESGGKSKKSKNKSDQNKKNFGNEEEEREEKEQRGYNDGGGGGGGEDEEENSDCEADDFNEDYEEVEV